MKSDQIPVQIDDADDGPRIGLLDALTWLGEAKRRIAILTAIVVACAAGITLIMTPIYTARTSLTAPATQSQGGGASAALSALGSLSALSGLGTSLAGKTPDEMYVAILKSDSVLRGLNTQFKLQERYEVRTFEALRKEMKNFVKITADKKSGVLLVEVEDEDPKFAADLANGYASEVDKVLARMMVTEAQQRRAFFELQLKDAKQSLVNAEQALRLVQEQSGMIVLDKQAETIIQAVAQLKSRIVASEVQLRVLRTSSTAANPEVQRRTTELAALRSELARMEISGAIASAGAASSPSGVDLPTSQLPATAVEMMRAVREVKLQETLLANMVRQYETARLDVAKDAPSLQQIDVAQPPDRKSSPARAQIVLVSAFVTLLLSSIWVVWRRYRALVNATDPQAAQAWSTMASAWRLRRKS
jgi:capsule polysaccharide export protein KpsE/RkpR